MQLCCMPLLTCFYNTIGFTFAFKVFILISNYVYSMLQPPFSAYFIWAAARENLSSGVCEQTSADQPAHPHSLISAFVIRFLESIICKPAIGEISIFLLVSVAEETGLKLVLSDTPKTGFLATRPISCSIHIPLLFIFMSR